MANEFVARKGLISSGSINVSGSVTASYFKGDGSQLTNITSASYAISSSHSDYAVSALSASWAPSSEGQTVAWDSVTNKPSGLVSSSTQINTGSFSGSFIGTSSWATNAVSASAATSITFTPSTASYALTASYVSGATSDWNSLSNKPADLVSSSTQVKTFLPNGTVSSSAQYPGWVTASSQIDITQTSGYTSFSSSLATVDQNQEAEIGALIAATSSYALQSQLAGVASSSSQVKAYLPDGTVSSSAQYPGWVTSSSQIDYNNIQNKLSGVYSSSTQTVASIAGQTIAPSNISASGVISGASIQISGDGSVGGNLTVLGILTAASQSIQYVSSSQFNVSTNKIIVNTNETLRFGGISVIDSGSINNTGSLYWDSVNDRWVYENSPSQEYNSAIIIAGPKNYGALGDERGMVQGRVPVGTGNDHIDGAPQSSSIRIDFATLQTDIEHGLFVTGSLTANGTVTLAGIPSSSAQVKVLLPDGTVSSSAQYPGWVTSSSQIDYNNIQNKLSDVVSSSMQVQPLLPNGTVSSSAQYPGWVTASSQIDYNNIQNKLSGVVSSSTQVAPLLPNGTVSSSTQVQADLPNGVVSSSAQYPGWVTASSQIDITQTSGYTSFSSSLATVDQNQQSQINALISSTSSYALQTQLAGVASSSVQVKAYLPDGTVSSSAQYPGWVTSSSQIDYNNIQNKLSGVISSSTQFNALSGTSASYATTASAATSITFTPSSASYALTASYVSGAASDWNSLSNKPADLVSSSAQVKAFLPDGTVSASSQYPGWVTASSQILLNSITGVTFSNSAFYFPQDLRVDGILTAQEIHTEYVSSSIIYESGSTKFGDTADDTHQFTGSLSVLGSISGALVLPAGTVSASSQIDYNSIQNKLSGVVSSSTQIQPLLPNGTVSSSAQYPGWVTASSQVDITQTTGYTSFSSSLATVDQNQQTQINALINNTSSYALQTQLAGVASSSAQVKAYLPDGTVSSSGQYPGWVTSSAQIDYNNIQNKLSGVISSSTQFNALSGTSASYATTASAATSITFTPLTASYANTASAATSITFTPSTASFAITSSYVNASGLPAGTVSASSQIDYNNIQNKLSGVISSSTQFNALSNTSASYALTASYAANATAVLPDGVISSSTQFKTLTDPFTGSFTGSFVGDGSQLTGIGATSIPAGTVSSSTQFKTLTDPFTGSFTGSFKGDGSQLTNIPMDVSINEYSYPADGVKTIYPIVNYFDPKTLIVAVGGITYNSIDDYTVSASNLIFNDPPASGSNILVKTFTTVTQNSSGSFSGSFIGDGSGLKHLPLAGTFDSYGFTGNGSETKFNISKSYADTSLIVSNNGMEQLRNVDYTLSASVVIFNTPPSSSAKVYVFALVNTGQLTGSFSGSFTGDGNGLYNLPTMVNIDEYKFVGDGSTVNYNISRSYNAGAMTVTVGGITYQSPDDYSITGNTIAFVESPALGSNIYVKGLMNVLNNATGSFSGSFSGTGYFNSVIATGNITAQSFTETSTITKKEDVRPIESQLDIIQTLQPSRFRWKDNHEEDIGLIAEMVDPIYPELVDKDTEGNPVGIHYSKLTVVLIKALQELTQKVNKLEGK